MEADCSWLTIEGVTPLLLHNVLHPVMTQTPESSYSEHCTLPAGGTAVIVQVLREGELTTTLREGELPTTLRERELPTTLRERGLPTTLREATYYPEREGATY